MFIRVYIYIYVYTCVCIYIYIYIHTWSLSDRELLPVWGADQHSLARLPLKLLRGFTAAALEVQTVKSRLTRDYIKESFFNTGYYISIDFR